jgi:hypothetical protein
MNERKIILERSKSRPLVICSMNPFQRSILGVVDDFPYNQNKSGAEGSNPPPTSTPFKLLTTHILNYAKITYLIGLGHIRDV